MVGVRRSRLDALAVNAELRGADLESSKYPWGYQGGWAEALDLSPTGPGGTLSSDLHERSGHRFMPCPHARR